MQAWWKINGDWRRGFPSFRLYGNFGTKLFSLPSLLSLPLIFVHPPPPPLPAPSTLCFAQTKLFSKFIGTECTAARRHPRDDLWSICYTSTPSCREHIAVILIVKKVTRLSNRWNEIISIIVVTGLTKLKITIIFAGPRFSSTILLFLESRISNGFQIYDKAR